VGGVDVRRTAAERSRGLGTTIFAEMSALATLTGSVNLGQGFPDTDGPVEVLEAAVEAIRTGVNQYPPGPGTPELRAAIAAHREHFTGLTYDPDGEVLVTTGATEAIAAALLGLVDPGDEVVVLEPYYDSYVAGITFAGGVRRPVTLRPPDYALDADELRSAVTDRTRLILLNTPHNPTGAVLSREELTAVADVAIAHDLVVVVDEVYEHMTFDVARPHIPLATLPGMRERTLSVSSAGKTFSVTGWKVGWVTGPADLVTAVRSVKQFLTYVSGAPFQPAIALGLRLPDAYFTSVASTLHAKRDRLCEGLAALGLDVHVPFGTYFATTDVRPLGYDDGTAFCRDLPHRAGVVAIPHAPFWDDHAIGGPLVRWAFCKKDDVLDEALRRLGTVFG
jgi:N-succinyldiaminopimelate aminotransferase